MNIRAEHEKFDEEANASDKSQNISSSSDNSCHSQKKNKACSKNDNLKSCGKSSIRWTQNEIKIAMHLFGGNIASRSLPSLMFIGRLQREQNVLVNRTPAIVKAWVSNQIRKEIRINDKKKMETANKENRKKIMKEK